MTLTGEMSHRSCTEHFRNLIRTYMGYKRVLNCQLKPHLFMSSYLKPSE